ncbi:MAG: GTP cyclohydrolase II [Myxococcales bacterium]|nr:GTP cyclohydrolase II [Myxococcales bacterium]MCB9629718.1 GTP cyclohydrolase II [Sandaracinaceae bacterium]
MPRSASTATMAHHPRPRLERFAEAQLPTEYGELRCVVFADTDTGLEHVALYTGDIAASEGLLTRVHSECLTGEVFHSLKCDCREQLDLAMRRVGEAGQGLVLYMRQEGRGIGLGNKIRAYAKQDEGYDTVDANRVLGFDDDLRRYDIAAAMLAELKVRSVRLMTNNPEKVSGLEAEGVVVTERVDHMVAAHEHNREYLETKRTRMGHLLDE